VRDRGAVAQRAFMPPPQVNGQISNATSDGRVTPMTRTKIWTTNLRPAAP